jgi:hypothetical protein
MQRCDYIPVYLPGTDCIKHEGKVMRDWIPTRNQLIIHGVIKELTVFFLFVVLSRTLRGWD